MIQLESTLKKRLFELKTYPIDILLVEDNELMRGTIPDAFKAIFPEASVKCLENFADDKFEIAVTDSKPQVVLLDGNLDKWPPHPLYGTFGPNLIPFIKETSPETIIISISLHSANNDLALERGAHLGIRKDKLTELIGAF